MRQPIVADLHTHSTASDGELPPEKVVDLAAAAGLEALALTDHDTVAGVEGARAQAIARGIELIPGCELTAYVGEIELHIVALFVDAAPQSSFVAFLKKLQQARRQRALDSVAKMRAAKMAIDEADVFEAAGSAQSIGRPHLAAALVKRGYAHSVTAALTRYLKEGQLGYVPKFKLTPEQAFEAVHATGGVALLAHPGSQPHDELISPLFRKGLDGVEAYSAAHSEVNRRFYAGLARRYEKLISGGSDFHGPTITPSRQVGASGVDRTVLAQLRQQAERWRAKAQSGV